MASVLLIRHGQASFGTANYDQLSPLGEEQSHDDWACWLKQSGSTLPDLVVVGPAAPHTCRPPTAASRPPVSRRRAVTIAGLDEFDHEEVLARLSARSGHADATHGGAGAVGDARIGRFSAMFSAAVARWVSGEFDHEYTRSWTAFRASVLTGTGCVGGQEARTIWAFTSGGPIAVIVNALVGAPAIADTFSLSWPLANTSTSRLSIEPEKPQSLISYNAWPHLEGAEARHLVSYR